MKLRERERGEREIVEREKEEREIVRLGKDFSLFTQ